VSFFDIFSRERKVLESLMLGTSCPSVFFSEEPFSDGGGQIPCLGLYFCPLTSSFALPRGLPQKSTRAPIEEAER